MSGTSTSTSSTDGTSNNTSSSNQSGTSGQSSSSATNPWAASMPTLNAILSKLQSQVGTVGLSDAQTNAINTLESNASAGNPYAASEGANATGLLSGGGAKNNDGTINQNYADYSRRLSGTADGNNIGKNSGLIPYLQTIADDTTNSVNSQFAASGRDMSGMNWQSLGRGIAQGEAPVIASQYNTDRTNQMNAASSLYGAGNTTTGLLNSTNQQDLSNRSAGVSAANSALDANNWGANQTLAAESQRTGIPQAQLSALSAMGINIAKLGSTSSGTSSSDSSSSSTGTSSGKTSSDTTGSQTMSTTQQIASILTSIGSLIPNSSK